MNLQAYILIGVISILVFSGVNYMRLRDENERLKTDVNGLSLAISNTATVVRSESGKVRAEVKTIKLSQDAATDYLSKDIKNIREEFRVKLKDLKSYTQIGTSYTSPVQSKGRDTVILQTIEKVYNLGGNISGSVYTKGDSLLGKVSLGDTIRIAVSKGKRKNWWRLWEKRPLVTNAFMNNHAGVFTELKSVVVE
jgi:hypothetical protein